MNERIRQLAKQAQILADEFQEQWKAGPSNEEFFQEKFAELIVKECCEVAHCNFHVDGLTLGGIMKKHFGVEE